MNRRERERECVCGGGGGGGETSSKRGTCLMTKTDSRRLKWHRV